MSGWSMLSLSVVKTMTAAMLRGRWLLRSVAPEFGRLLDDRAGGVLLTLALSMAIIIGFAGLGTEAANWYFTKRAMQGAADAAATTAAASRAAGAADNSILVADAKSVTAAHNFADLSNGTVVTVYYPPSSGTLQGNTEAVEVLISQPQPKLISALFLPAEEVPTISVRAVARTSFSTGTACVIALDPLDETSVTVSGTSTALTLPACSLYVNSPSKIAAVDFSGGATITPDKAYIVGKVHGPGLSEAAARNALYEGVSPLADPYAHVSVPSYSGCNENGYKLVAGATQALNAADTGGVYVFCNGLDLAGGSTLNLGPGTYIIDRGLWDIKGGATLNAPLGVTIILTTSNAAKRCATAEINGGANMTLAAPTEGPLAGIAIYQDRKCDDHTLVNNLTGGGTQNITGAIYFPETNVDYSGGSATGGAQCTQLIAWKIQFAGGSQFNSNCTGTGTNAPKLTSGRLVE